MILSVLEQGADGVVHDHLVEVVRPDEHQRLRPVEALSHPRRLVEPHVSQLCRHQGHVAGQRDRHVRGPDAKDFHFAAHVGMFHPVVEATTLEGIVDVSSPVRGNDHHRGHLGGERAQLGHRHRIVRQDLQQKRLELVIGPVNLVNEQHRGRPAGRRQGLEQRPPDQESLIVEFVLQVGG